MILIAVIVGYILGVAPFIVPKLLEMKQDRVNKEVSKEDIKTQNEIFDEWLNGETKTNSKIQKNQEDIYEEYITGKEVMKGE